MNLTKLPQSEQAALQIFREGVVSLFADRLADLRLFGSKARSDSNDESDTDVLVLIHRLTAQEKKKVIDLATEIFLKTDVLLSPLTMTPEEFSKLLRQERMLALDIQREGISL